MTSVSTVVGDLLFEKKNIKHLSAKKFFAPTVNAWEANERLDVINRGKEW